MSIVKLALLGTLLAALITPTALLAKTKRIPGGAVLEAGVILVKEVKLNHPCQDGDLPEMPGGWDKKWCTSGGTGMAHCDDGKTVLDIDSQGYCYFAISKHQK